MSAAPSMVAIVDNPLVSRFELRVNGELAGYVLYEDTSNGRGFEHTAVAAKVHGRGLAARLVVFALDEARTNGRAVVPFCPFVRTFIKSHPEYVDVVAKPQHFGLLPAPATGDANDAPSTHEATKPALLR